MYPEEEQGYGNQGGGRDQNARAKQLCSSTPEKAEKGRERNHFTTSKKNEHPRVLEVQAARQQPVSGYRCA